MRGVGEGEKSIKSSYKAKTGYDFGYLPVTSFSLTRRVPYIAGWLPIRAVGVIRL
jgi:hypothetical protein